MDPTLSDPSAGTSRRSSAARRRERTAGTWLEILPVHADAVGLWFLRPRSKESWRMRWGRGGAVTQVVRRRLAAAGGRAAVVHSTSWREERQAILLTHLAVIAGPTHGRLRDFERRPVRRRDLRRGTATSPPGRIEVEDVVEHAMRHLAWLTLEYRTVQAALDGRWRESLRSYQPEPFCVFGTSRASDRARPAACRCGPECRCGTVATGGIGRCI
ncbi:MAG TPA: hypothetical protein VLW53_22505 [Candidatus Eisenbacteria bacterium]|nr:hypothetical protein [Candidatus Eisenbacteria bacterium]